MVSTFLWQTEDTLRVFVVLKASELAKPLFVAQQVLCLFIVVWGEFFFKKIYFSAQIITHSVMISERSFISVGSFFCVFIDCVGVGSSYV